MDQTLQDLGDDVVEGGSIVVVASSREWFFFMLYIYLSMIGMYFPEVPTAEIQIVLFQSQKCWKF